MIVVDEDDIELEPVVLDLPPKYSKKYVLVPRAKWDRIQHEIVDLRNKMENLIDLTRTLAKRVRDE